MPKLERWLVASKVVDVLEPETARQIMELGGQIGGGWYEVHTHICVNQDNKERVEHLLEAQGLTITPASEHAIEHPECHHHEQERSVHH